jgi:glycosyltransferase involved in cell wall biosynthesis
MIKPRVLHIIPSLRKGGAERLVIDICRSLEKENLAETLLLTMHPENDYAYLTDEMKIIRTTSYVKPSLKGKDSVCLKDYDAILDNFRPQIIHSHLFEAEWLSRWKIRKDTAYITHCHDNMRQLRRLKLLPFPDKQTLTDFYERSRLIPRYRGCNNQFIAISKDTESYFRKVLPHSLRNNIHLLHNAIDYERFRRPPRKEICTAPLHLLSVGSLVPKKNQIFLVDVVRLLKKQGLSVKLDLLGHGQEREKIRAAVNASGLQDEIVLHGNVNNVEEFLEKAQIYVHAATYEPFGLVLLEAMAAGLPVVCLDGRGNRDVILDGENACMIRQNDPALFATAIISLVRDNNKYESFSRKACEHAGSFSIQKYSANLSDLYQSLLRSC